MQFKTSGHGHQLSDLRPIDVAVMILRQHSEVINENSGPMPRI